MTKEGCNDKNWVVIGFKEGLKKILNFLSLGDPPPVIESIIYFLLIREGKIQEF